MLFYNTLPEADLGLRISIHFISGVEPDPREDEPKLNSLMEPEPKLRIAYPAPFS
jgi:hypothetical protein